VTENNDLDPRGRDVEVGPLIVRTPGFEGTAVLLDDVDVEGRGPQLGTEELAQALAETDMSEKYTLELENVRRDRSDADADGRGREETEEIVIEVPAPAADEGQILMLVEEDGAITWHLPETSETPPESRGREMVVFRVPAREIPLPPDETDSSDRGIISAIGSKVLKILTYPLAPVLRAAGTAFTKAWETDHRPARFRTLTAENYGTDQDVSELSRQDWERLSKGPALLFLHGTFASSHTAFRQLPVGVLNELSQRYGGRVFALDHHSIWLPPSENAKLAAAAVPDGISLEVDIVAHSRGGLIARELAERAADAGFGESLRVRRIVMVATPNAGTALAEEANIRKWLDIITNVAQFVPDNPVTDIIALVLTVLKQLALGVFEGLPGLTSMDPSGSYLKALNIDGDFEPRYYAIAADFEPPSGAPLTRIAHDLAIDTLFSGGKNDLVVPTAGAGVIPGLPRFAPESLVFDSEHGLDHSSYFRDPEVVSKLKEWLPG
jgi:pimeloyl-ACP methyl ester carboxylesterase